MKGYEHDWYSEQGETINRIECHVEKGSEYRKIYNQLENMINEHLQSLPKEQREREKEFIYDTVISYQMNLCNLYQREVLCRFTFDDYDDL